ncbi:MAG: tyrosine-type recombinase/integrase [Planctomycetes bacterium]|nr:tyrosine-type recombinase/integrase [Planctomycetota bacterium]
MTRREVFYKKSHKAWYVQFDGHYVRLLAGPNDTTTKDAANDIYEEMKLAKKKADRFVVPDESIPVSLGSLLDQFVASGFKGKSDYTRRWYTDKLKPLIAHLGREFSAQAIKPFHVDQWIAAHPDWASGTARNLWRAVQRLYRWGHRKGLIPESTVLHQEKPRAGKREVVISPDQYAELLAFVRNDEFKSIITVAWETGARTQELMAARVRHLDVANTRLVFPPEESKDKDRPRVIYLTDTALALLKPKAGSEPDDHLLKNSEGRPWTADASLCAFAAMHKRMLKAKVKSRKYCLYHFRHSWLDRMLKAGVDALTCAILMGHRDTSMIARTYQHLSQSPDYLRAALKKAAG